MGTSDGAGIRGTTARERHPWLVVALISVLLIGCSDEGARSSRVGGTPRPAAGAPGTTASEHPSSDSPRPLTQRRLDKLAHLFERVELLDRIPPGFELRDVDYTSRTDAVAYFVDTRIDDRGTIIATTDDNWAHSARLRISYELADLVDYVALGRGAVGIKARDQFPSRMYPMFVLYPDGDMQPLRVVESRSPDADTEVLGADVHSLFNWMSTPEPPGLWASDAEAGEIFPIDGAPNGYVRQHVPGRDGTLFNVLEYRRGIGGGVWRYETSRDAGRSWERTDVGLPLGHRKLGWYTDVTTHAMGPRHLQALAMSHAWEDLPLYLWELWWTDDEEEFRRVRLPWDRLRFGGMAFTPDGALLLAEVGGTDHYCDQLTCNRPGRIWRLASHSAAPRLVAGAPKLFGPFWAVGIGSSGGWIVARTGMRTIALSRDGRRWTEVTPGG
jgi:hypothetical protein